MDNNQKDSEFGGLPKSLAKEDGDLNNEHFPPIEEKLVGKKKYKTILDGEDNLSVELNPSGVLEKVTIKIPYDPEFKPYLIPNPDNPKYPGIRLREGVIRLTDSQRRLLQSRK